MASCRVAVGVVFSRERIHSGGAAVAGHPFVDVMHNLSDHSRSSGLLNSRRINQIQTIMLTGHDSAETMAATNCIQVIVLRRVVQVSTPVRRRER